MRRTVGARASPPRAESVAHFVAFFVICRRCGPGIAPPTLACPVCSCCVCVRHGRRGGGGCRVGGGGAPCRRRAAPAAAFESPSCGASGAHCFGILRRIVRCSNRARRTFVCGRKSNIFRRSGGAEGGNGRRVRGKPSPCSAHGCARLPGTRRVGCTFVHICSHLFTFVHIFGNVSSSRNAADGTPAGQCGVAAVRAGCCCWWRPTSMNSPAVENRHRSGHPRAPRRVRIFPHFYEFLLNIHPRSISTRNGPGTGVCEVCVKTQRGGRGGREWSGWVRSG